MKLLTFSYRLSALAVACVATLSLCVTPACAQTPPPPAAPVQVTIFAGPTFDGHKVGGALGASYPTSATNNLGLRADLSFQTGQRPQTTIGGFFEQLACHVGAYPVILVEDVGASFLASDPTATVQKTGALVTSLISNAGTNVGYLAATGVRTEIGLGRGWYIRPGVRAEKGSLNGAGVVASVTFAKAATVSLK